VGRSLGSIEEEGCVEEMCEAAGLVPGERRPPEGSGGIGRGRKSV